MALLGGGGGGGGSLVILTHQLLQCSYTRRYIISTMQCFCEDINFFDVLHRCCGTGSSAVICMSLGPNVLSW
jgi:hypothetical protein